MGAKPDKLDDEARRPGVAGGIFGVTVVAFFVAEMGDRRRSRRSCWLRGFRRSPPCSATFGMLLANVPVVLAGRAASRNSVQGGEDRRGAPVRALGVYASCPDLTGGGWVNAGIIPRCERSRRAEFRSLHVKRPYLPARSNPPRRVSGGQSTRIARIESADRRSITACRCCRIRRAAAHGARAQLHDQRHDVPALAAERVQRADADGLGRLRTARRERGDEERRAAEWTTTSPS
jgi:hypothetical protein